MNYTNRIYKENYENTKKKFDESRDIFDKARERLGNANDIRSNEEIHKIKI